MGGINLSNVRRGVAQAAAVGYWMGQPYAGQGLMTDALRATLPFAFDELRLHRLEAACLPHNEPSKGVLTKVGFHEEGLARQYLRINGPVGRPPPVRPPARRLRSAHAGRALEDRLGKRSSSLCATGAARFHE